MASGQGKLVGRNETTKFLSPNRQHRRKTNVKHVPPLLELSARALPDRFPNGFRARLRCKVT